MKCLADNLQGCNDNHIFPFFWQHGEAPEVLREYVGKIAAAGITSFCVEARPHPEFVGAGWWHDLDIIVEEARRRQMTLWILDDAHFPTGYANGAIEKKFPQYRKRFLKLVQYDFAGPQKNAEALLNYALADEEDKIIGVFLAEKKDFSAVEPYTIMDISDNVSVARQVVQFDLPPGTWKLLILVTTFKGGEKETEGYLNPLLPEATDVLIREVYEPHYAHYGREFGKSIRGFFSDEPRFGNVHGSEGSIGRLEMVLPWREDMPKLLAEHVGQDVKKLLPLLFVDGGRKAYAIRYYYMDLVSRLYGENFSGRLGDWCKAHGVEYIGHTIEDNNASARLGYGAGHFFRAMQGQDMAGIDVVLHQLMPGLDKGRNRAMTRKGWDGEFFHYVLAKLGASLGHTDPRKKGRVMCEVFGAYGWAEGVRLMKWLIDHMLVRGVNEFCPHAFNPHAYPDHDCPPHFYAHGHNPQFADFKLLMDYTNRMAHLLSGGIHKATAAVVYHGEAEWSGDYMLEQKPCALLARNQIDYDILPIEVISQAVVHDGRLHIAQEEFAVLIVPYAEAWPCAFWEKLAQLAAGGLPIVFLEEMPRFSSEGIDIRSLMQQLESSPAVVVKSLREMVPFLHAQGLYEIKSCSYEPYLRYYHYKHTDGEVVMFVNEAAGGTLQTKVSLPFSGKCYRYDPFANKVWEINIADKLNLHLASGQSLVICRGDVQGAAKQVRLVPVGSILLNNFHISFAKSINYPDFTDDMVISELRPLQQIAGKEDFAGIIRYETSFVLEKITAATRLQVLEAYEGVRVSVNGGQWLHRICRPYEFDISNDVIQGENSLCLEVTTTLVREQKDFLSQFMLLEPTGISGTVMVEQLIEAEA